MLSNKIKQLRHHQHQVQAQVNRLLSELKRINRSIRALASDGKKTKRSHPHSLSRCVGCRRVWPEMPS